MSSSSAEHCVPQIYDPALNYINGSRVAGAGDTFSVLDPCSGRSIVDYPLATAGQVETAVAAARSAFPGWSQSTPGERSGLIQALAGKLEEKALELAAVESAQTGKPHKLSSGFDVPGTVDNTSFFAGAARILEGTAAGEYSPDHTSMIRREPIGVIGSIAPWNYPLQMAGWKILPAIAAGNTIVLKPSEITPLTTLLFAEAATEAGIPAGVVNVVTGTGAQAGNALTGHPDVDMVSFAGSTAVGRGVMAACRAGRPGASGTRRESTFRGLRGC